MARIMLIEGMSEQDIQSRIVASWLLSWVFPHLDRKVVIPVGVIHGRSVDEQRNLGRLLEMGYVRGTWRDGPVFDQASTSIGHRCRAKS